MSCIKNLSDPDPSKWIAAGTPLPNMMTVERRKGAQVPVIEKALVKLDSEMFKGYEAVRDKWALIDCYQSPGPLQFNDHTDDDIPYLVKPPPVERLVKETEEFEKYEKARKEGDPYHSKLKSVMSDLSKKRIEAKSPIPDTLEKGDFVVQGIKKYRPFSKLVDQKIKEQFVALNHDHSANYFVEITDNLVIDEKYFTYEDKTLQCLNKELAAKDFKSSPQRIGVVYVGRQAPGGNNVIDGLLRYQAHRDKVEILGFINGVRGFLEGKYIDVTREKFAPFNNLGGYDFLGRSIDMLRKPDQLHKAVEVCRKLKLTGLILIGATHTLTDCAYIAEYFLQQKLETRVVAVPATVDGNIHHGYIATSIGFDTAAKIYSQHVGNMLTDSASAVKYWYFMRLMGRDPSHLVLEVALRTHPNIVIISEESSHRGQTLPDIVNKICDIICNRAAQGMNYGSVVIPEGLLNYISNFKHLIQELNELFKEQKTAEEAYNLSQKLFNDLKFAKEQLTPWSFSLFETLPDFLKNQLLSEREVHGSVRLSQIETEKLLAYYCDIELKKRAKAGTYSGAFAPVTHYFGYQGRCSHPTLFDSSLGSTYGFTAGVLIEGGFTGISAAVRQVTGSPDSWRVGGIPLLALMRSEPKTGYTATDLVVPSEDVDLQGEPYQRMKALERNWRMMDHYSNPGPIQFYAFGSDELSTTLKLMYSNYTRISQQIQALCTSIQKDCLFTEHQHLLFAALSSLQSAKGVINSMQKSLIYGAYEEDEY